MMKLNFVSISAASDYTDADKHINLGKATTAGKKIEAAAKKFAAAQAKGDAVASKVMVKLAAKTQRQIEKALAPIAYYYVSKKTKPVPYSAAKQKAQDVTYMRKRAVRVMTRKRPSDAYTLVFAAYNPAILGKEAAAIQRDLIKAVEMHGGASVKTKETATKVSMQRNDEASKIFNANVSVLTELLGTKVKPEQVYNYVPARGVPATYITLPNKGVVVVRHADVAQLRAIKKKAAEAEAKASTSGESESAADMHAIVSEQARFARDSGGKVEYSRMEGSYFISCDGHHVAELRNDEADDFAATVSLLMRQAHVSAQDAQLAAASGWIGNSESSTSAVSESAPYGAERRRQLAELSKPRASGQIKHRTLPASAKQSAAPKKKETSEERAKRVAATKEFYAKHKEKVAGEKAERKAAIEKAKDSFKDAKEKIAQLKESLKGKAPDARSRIQKTIQSVRDSHNSSIKTIIRKYGSHGFASSMFKNSTGAKYDAKRRSRIM